MDGRGEGFGPGAWHDAGAAHDAGVGAGVRAGAGVGVARAPGWRRVTAWLVDFSLVITVAVLLGFFTFNRISAMLGDVEGLAGTGAWKVLTSDGDLAEAGQALGESLWRRSVRAVQQGFGLLVLCAFLYQFLALAFAGTTLGKALLGLRVGVADGTGGEPRRPARRAAAVRAGVTTVADVALLSLACCLLLSGAFLASGVVLVLTVAVYLANAVPALVGARRSLADRFAGTRVHGGLIGTTAALTARYTAQGGRAAWQAAQRVAESERTRAALDRGRQLLPRARRGTGLPGEVPEGGPLAGLAATAGALPDAGAAGARPDTGTPPATDAIPRAGGLPAADAIPRAGAASEAGATPGGAPGAGALSGPGDAIPGPDGDRPVDGGAAPGPQGR